MEEKSKKQLISELSALRQKNEALEESLALLGSDEKALWKNVKKYRILIENSHDIIYTLNPHGVFTFVSPSWTSLLGHPISQVVGKTFQQFVHPDDIGVCEVFLKKVIETNQRQAGVEYRVQHADGSWRWHTSNGAPLKDESGVVISYEGIASDITEKKRAEEALKESQQKLSDIINFLPDATFVIDKEGEVIAWNRAMEEMTGINAADMLGKGNYEYALPFYGERRPILIDLVLQPRKDIEDKYTRTDRKNMFLEAEACIPSFRGREVYLFGKANILSDSKGKIVGAIESIRDVTVRKQAQEALKESQEQLSDIIDFLPDATLVIDKEGKVIAWNRAMEEMTGIKAADMLGKDNYEYALPFYGERRPILIDLVLQSRKDIETRYTRKQRKEMSMGGEAHIPSFRGRDVYLFGKANILCDSKGNVVGAIESIRDVTVRKKAEEAVKYSEERFSKAFRMNPVPTIICTIKDGRYIDVNDSFLRMLGYKREEMIGKKPDDLSIWLDIAEQRHIALKLLKDGFLREESLHVRSKAGDIHHLLVSAEIIVQEREKFVLCLFNDITEQEKLESQLRQSQRMESIGTLAGGIAHDFNNILGAVMGYTEMALGKPNVDDHLRRYLQQIFKASERARDLVKQILVFSRKGDEKLMPLRVSPIIKEVLKLLRATLPSTIKISQNIYPDPDMVLADPTQIHQIMMNLCTNAAYAMPEKKGDIKVSLVSEKIESDFSSGLDSGMYLKLIVSDTGIGMDSKTMGRIFDPFFTTKNPGEGTGLGLSVVYGIVKSYGGTITVQSEVGKGTEFCVYLPLFMKDDEHKEEKAEASVLGGRECILFVDDEEPLVELGESVLASLGYDVVGKRNSQEALELFSTSPEKFDLVVTDMTMPNMTGIDLAQNILRIKPGTPIILCTGFSETVTQERIDSAGVKDLIMKPFKRQQIAESIRRTLDKKE